MKPHPPILKTAGLWTLAMLAVAGIAVGLLGVYGIPVTVVVGLAGFHLFARWYHRRYYGGERVG